MCYFKTSALSEFLTCDLEDNMLYAEQKIMCEVAVHMSKYGVNYQEWYAGVAADPKARLFNDHGVKETGDAWISRQCVNAASARDIERYFMKKGCKGGQAGEVSEVSEDKSTLFFYAYMIQPHTRQ
jgi:hypothetical protein